MLNRRQQIEFHVYSFMSHVVAALGSIGISSLGKFQIYNLVIWQILEGHEDTHNSYIAFRDIFVVPNNLFSRQGACSASGGHTNFAPEITH